MHQTPRRPPNNEPKRSKKAKKQSIQHLSLSALQARIEMGYNLDASVEDLAARVADPLVLREQSRM